MERAPGQLSIWDIEVIEINKKVMEKPKSFIKTVEKAPKVIDSFAVLEKYKSKEGLSRIVQYCGGGYGIEFKLEDNFRTIYVNAEGQEEFIKNKRLPVLPMDKILHYKTADIPLNDFQEEKLKELKVKYPMAKIIRRKGDENVILGLENKVISITPRWVLEFRNIEATYEEDEVIQEDMAEDLEELHKRVKTGDYVQAQYGPELIEGTITREYGICNEILNIIFDNNKKHTAICRDFVVKILKAA